MHGTTFGGGFIHLLVWFLSELQEGCLFWNSLEVLLSFLWFSVVLVIGSPNWPVFWTFHRSSSAGFAVSGAEEQFFLIISWFCTHTHKLKIAGRCGCQPVSTDASQQDGSDPAPLLFLPTVKTDAQGRWLKPKLPLGVMSGPSSQPGTVGFGSDTTFWSQLRNGLNWMKGNLKSC